MNTDTVMDISPITVTGYIGHINHHGQSWVHSDVRVTALEELAIPDAPRTGIASQIVSVELSDISNTSMQSSSRRLIIMC